MAESQKPDILNHRTLPMSIECEYFRPRQPLPQPLPQRGGGLPLTLIEDWNEGIPPSPLGEGLGEGLTRGRMPQFLAVFLVLFLSACGSDFFYEKKYEIQNDQWAYSDTLNFKFSIVDTAEIYNIYLDIDYADTFSRQNVYMKLYTRFPDGKRLSKQKSFELFDVQGNPLGQCSGRECRLHALLQENAFFNSPGDYEITLEQYTRMDPLPGIRAVGMALEATGTRRGQENGQD